jgi:hypothetical protein
LVRRCRTELRFNTQAEGAQLIGGQRVPGGESFSSTFCVAFGRLWFRRDFRLGPIGGILTLPRSPFRAKVHACVHSFHQGARLLLGSRFPPSIKGTTSPSRSNSSKARFWDSHDLTDFERDLEEVTEPVFVRTKEERAGTNFQESPSQPRRSRCAPRRSPRRAPSNVPLCP